MDQIENTIKAFVLGEFLPGEDPEELTNATPLISGGILDSLAMLKMVAFLEEEFQIEIQAHETGMDHMNTIADISALVKSKGTEST
jgi:acyl carrier protein